MTSTVIFKTDSKLKSQAQKTAEGLGLTLTSVMNGYLKDFVQKKSVSFGKTKKNYKDPYGIFKDSKITEKDIDDVTSSWDKIIDELA
jgi:antitoxin component of RelBE/YafQ-DinJ toxin-antitoxin module